MMALTPLRGLLAKLFCPAGGGGDRLLLQLLRTQIIRKIEVTRLATATQQHQNGQQKNYSVHGAKYKLQTRRKLSLFVVNTPPQ